MIMFQCQVAKHKGIMLTGASPSKLPKVKVEEQAEHAAFVQWLVGEVKTQVPVLEDELRECFLDRWIKNDPQLHLEITSLLATRAEDFNVRTVTVLNELMVQHAGPKNGLIIEAMTKLEGHKEQLADKEFALLLSQLTYDTDT